MVHIKLCSDGNYYISRYVGSKARGVRSTREWYFVKQDSDGNSRVGSSGGGLFINAPKEFAGKRIRFKVEVLP